jgi:tetratricopeptide (TPR) repeat protein
MARLRAFRDVGCSLLLALGLAAPTASPAWAAGGGGGGGGDGGGYSPGSSGPSRAQKAQEKFEAGERHRQRGIELESRAAASGAPAEAGRLRGEARAEFEQALREYRGAVREKRDLVAAHNGIGFARRKLGDYEGALEAYDRALELKPRFALAIEYRGEAYLELGRLDDAKGAYLQLFDGERELADQLLGKMQAWVVRRRQDPSALAPGQIEDFSRWVEERAEIARQTARLPAQGGAGW